MEVNQIILSLFFTYFVLMMTDIHTILNCSLQRFLKNNLWIKHFTIFASIFVFTFVLGWYRFDSLVVENYKNNNDIKNNNDSKKKQVKTNILLKYFVNSLIIYVLFIISTKNEGKFLFFFLVISLFLFLLQVHTKNINPEYHKYIYKKYYINSEMKKKITKELKPKNDTQKKNLNKIMIFHNLTFILMVFLIFVLVFGMYSYYKKKKIIFKKDFNFVKFIFGTNTCSDYNTKTPSLNQKYILFKK